MDKIPSIWDRQRLARIEGLWHDLKAAGTDRAKCEVLAAQIRRETDAFVQTRVHALDPKH